MGTCDMRGRIWAVGSRGSGGLGASASDGAAGVSVPGVEPRQRTWPIFSGKGPERGSRLGPTHGASAGIADAWVSDPCSRGCPTGLGRLFWNMLQTFECEGEKNRPQLRAKVTCAFSLCSVKERATVWGAYAGPRATPTKPTAHREPKMPPGDRLGRIFFQVFPTTFRIFPMKVQ